MNNTAPEMTTDENVAAYLAAQGITYTAALMGETKRDGWACDEWRVRLEKRAQPDKAAASMETRFYTGLGHRAKPKRRTSWDDSPRPVAPTAASVLYSLLADAAGAEKPFDYWAADYGYDTDSIKALNTYNACCEIRRQVNAFFTHVERETLRTMLENY